MMWLTENIQACLRIFRRAQHQWLVRDILHPSQGVFTVFVLLPGRGSKVQIRPIRLIRGRNLPILWRTALQAEAPLWAIPRALPPVTHGSALQAPECLWSIIRGRKRIPRTVVYSCLSPCDRCKNPGGVMMWLAENIQACLRIFRQAQHQWLVRDILHLPQGVFIVFVLWHR